MSEWSRKAVGASVPRHARTAREGRVASILAAAMIVGVALASVPLALDEAHAAVRSVYIDDSLQTGPLTSWDIQGSRWTPTLMTVAETNQLERHADTKDCWGQLPTKRCQAAYDASRDGRWLTLTSDNTQANGQGESGFVLHKKEFASDLGVVIEYDQRVFRSNNGKSGTILQGGGDGISLFLLDAHAPDHGLPGVVDTNLNQPGGYGAALGYSSVASTGDSWCSAQQGLAGAYMGIGFDVYGNFQKAEDTPAFGATVRATRPRSVSGRSPLVTSDATRLPQSIGLRGSGVRFTGPPSCATELNRAYGLLEKPEVNNAGFITVYSAIWDAGTQASDYRFQYRTSDNVWHSWFDMEPSTRPGNTAGMMQARIPASAGDVTFAIQKKSEPARYSETAGVSQDAIVAGASSTRLTSGSTGGYRWLAGTASHGNTVNGAWIDNPIAQADGYRRVRVTLTPRADGAREVVVAWSDKLDMSDDVCVDRVTKLPNGLVGAACSGTAGEWRHGTNPTLTEQFRYDLGASPYQAALPAEFRLGFAASTGWAVNFHQIRNVRVTTPTDITVAKKVAIGAPTPATTWADAATGQAGDVASYRIVATNAGPSDLDPGYPATLVEPLTSVPYADTSAVAWTAVATDGARILDPATGTWVSELSGTGPLTSAAPLRWHSPSVTIHPAAAVTVTFSGTVATGTAAGTYPNTAAVTTSTLGGPQESELANNTDDATLTIIDPDTWGVAKTSTPVSGAAVTAGREIGYTVTVTADGVPGRGDVRGVVLTDDLSDVLGGSAPHATFVPGSARLTIGAGPATAVPDPTGTTLTTAPFDLPHGQTATLTYAVTVREDVAPGATFRNVVTGSAQGSEPTSCAPPTDPDDLDPRCSTVHHTPDWTAAKTVTNDDAADPSARLAPGALVQPGDTLTYRVTATNDSTAVPVRVSLTDDLSHLLGGSDPAAAFVPGSVALTIGGSPASATLPTTPDAAHVLAVGPFELPPATTGPGGVVVPSTAVLTYRVTVAQDAWSATLRNVVTARGDDGDPAHPVPPAACTPTAPCETTQRTPALVQIEKRGEDTTGTVVPMDGSAWALHDDDGGAPAPAPRIAAVPAATDASSAPITGLFRTPLPPGTYWLVETRALPGFALLPEPVELTVAATGEITLGRGASAYVTVRDDTAVHDAWTVVVRDVPALELPEAGGPGTQTLRLAGAALLLLALTCAVTARRRRPAEGA